MDHNTDDEIVPPGAPNQQQDNPVVEAEAEDFRAIFYRMEVSRRVEDFCRAIQNGRESLIVEISQLIIYKSYFNEQTGAHQTSIQLLQLDYIVWFAGTVFDNFSDVQRVQK